MNGHGLEQDKTIVEVKGKNTEKKVQKNTLDEELAAFKERLKRIADADSDFFFHLITETDKTVKFSIEKNKKVQGTCEFNPLNNEMKFDFTPTLSFDEKKAAFEKGMEACSQSMSGDKLHINLPKEEAREVIESVLVDHINAGKMDLSLEHSSLTPEKRTAFLQSLLSKGANPDKLRESLTHASSAVGLKQLDILTKSTPSQANTGTDQFASASPFFATKSAPKKNPETAASHNL